MRHLSLHFKGNVDRLTGLDSPEIFYKFLEKSISSQSRSTSSHSVLVRFRLRTAPTSAMDTRDSGVEREIRGSKSHDVVQSKSSREADPSQYLPSSNNAEQVPLAESEGETDPHDEEVAFAVAHFAKFLSRMTRSDETITRIGERTFLLLASVNDESQYAGLLNRFKIAISQIDLNQERCSVSVDTEGFIHQSDEKMLEFLERVAV